MRNDYSLREWADTGADNFTIGEEELAHFRGLIGKVTDFAVGHGIPVAVVFTASEDDQSSRTVLNGNLPMRRTSGLLLATMFLARDGLTEDTIDNLQGLLELECDRNCNTPSRVSARPQLKLVTKESLQ